MNAIIPSSGPAPLKFQSKAVVAGKVLLVAALITGLSLAVFFSTGALSSFISAGAAAWKIGLTAVGIAGAGTTLLGGIYFAAKYNMFEDTDRNAEDVKNYLLKTFGTGLYVGGVAFQFVREYLLWNLILKS